MDGQHTADERPRHRGTTRRRLLLGTGAAGAAGLLGWWGATRLAGERAADDSSDAPVRQCLAEREFPADFSTALQASNALVIEAEDLGTPFTTVSLQDIVRVNTDDGRDRLLITQHGATAQIQFVTLDGSEGPIVHHVEFGINPGVAVSADGSCWFVTREEGRVLSINPALSGLTDLGRVNKDATSLYSPVIGPGGLVFGGSYPTGAVWAADPVTGKITLGPRIGDNQYVRSLAVVGERLFAGTGGNEPILVEIDPVTLGPLQEYEVPGARAGGVVNRLVALPGQRLLVYRDESDGGADGVHFDPETGNFGTELTPGASSRSLTTGPAPGEVVYVAGSSVMRWDPLGGVPEEAGPSAIENPAAVLTLEDGSVIAVIAEPDGSAAVAVAQILPEGGTHSLEVVGSAHDITAVIPMPSTSQLAIGGYQGDGLVVLASDGGDAARTSRGTGVQQVEGGIESGVGSVLVGSYGQGRVHELRLEPSRGLLESVQVDDLGEDFAQARPIAWARLGARFAVGTVPEQGRQGGLVQVFERTDGGPLAASGVVKDPADGQSVVGIAEAAEGEAIITTSVRGGYGVDARTSEARVMRIDLSSGEVIWDTPVPAGDAYTPTVQRERIFCGTTSGVLVLDLETGEQLVHAELGEPATEAGYTSARIEPWEVQGRFLHSARGRLCLVDLVDSTVRRVADGVSSRFTVLGEHVYSASGAHLTRMSLPRSENPVECA